MATIADHRRKALVAGIAAGCTLGLAGVLAVSRGAQTRSSLMAQLERPAQPRLAAGFSTTFGQARLRGKLALSVNRAGLPDPARLTITAGDGRALTGGRVTLTYSMPSMDMWRVYSSRLDPVPGAPGSYAATEGVLGMAGVWRIEVSIAVPGRSSASFALNDRMPA